MPVISIALNAISQPLINSESFDLYKNEIHLRPTLIYQISYALIFKCTLCPEDCSVKRNSLHNFHIKIQSHFNLDNPAYQHSLNFYVFFSFSCSMQVLLTNKLLLHNAALLYVIHFDWKNIVAIHLR